MTNAIVVVIDRLRAGYLGPYGNTWLDTPCFNQLGAESTLHEWAIADSTSLEQTYRSYWHGGHAAIPTSDSDSLFQQLADKNVNVSLMSDEPDVCSASGTDAIADVIQLPVGDFQTAQSVDETQLARTFAAAIDKIQSLSSPFLFWLHAAGMSAPWDAPLELREQFADEEDPTPPDFVRPPSLELAADVDPDDVLGFTQAYAGQIMVCDLCIGALLDVVSSMGDVQLIVTSPRGYPLGEHSRVGDLNEALFAESLHVPWFVRSSTRESDAIRSHDFVQPADLHETLCKWFDLPMQRPSLPKDRVFAWNQYEQAIQTPAWFLRRADEQSNLFVKPDDRWEMNEISDRCGDVVEELSKHIDEFLQAAQQNDFSSLSSLSDILLNGLE